MEVLSNGWVSIGLAYVFGVVTGWTVWGVLFQRQLSVKNAESEEETAPSAGDEMSGAQAQDAPAGIDDSPSKSDKNSAANPPQEILQALETELSDAKALLKEEARRTSKINDILGDLDGAIKRANGRLKLLVKSLKNKTNEQGKNLNNAK